MLEKVTGLVTASIVEGSKPATVPLCQHVSPAPQAADAEALRQRSLPHRPTMEASQGRAEQRRGGNTVGDRVKRAFRERLRPQRAGCRGIENNSVVISTQSRTQGSSADHNSIEGAMDDGAAGIA
jgi:hypothetical protein